jgi:hypothetical protein
MNAIEYLIIIANAKINHQKVLSEKVNDFCRNNSDKQEVTSLRVLLIRRMIFVREFYFCRYYIPSMKNYKRWYFFSVFWIILLIIGLLIDFYTIHWKK